MTTVELTIERGSDDAWRELGVEVRGTVTGPRRATLLDPPESSETEIVSVTCDGRDFELDADEEAKALEMLERQAREDAVDARATRADWERDCRRDERFG
jgi:hypothetical protein